MSIEERALQQLLVGSMVKTIYPTNEDDPTSKTKIEDLLKEARKFKGDPLYRNLSQFKYPGYMSNLGHETKIALIEAIASRLAKDVMIFRKTQKITDNLVNSYEIYEDVEQLIIQSSVIRTGLNSKRGRSFIPPNRRSSPVVF
jgi:hypothetical protein